jgi:hypothetical protein
MKKEFKKCVWCKASFVYERPNQKVCSIACAKADAEQTAKHKEKIKKQDWQRRKLELTIEAKPELYKEKLQKSVNQLARMIDERFDLKCIDCEKDFGKQCDGGHFTPVGSNRTLRYNLHNIHSQKSDCNKNGLGGGKRLEYRRGLESRYGVDYADFVEFELPVKYKSLVLSNKEIYNYHRLALQIIRKFKQFEFSDAKQGRELINSLLGMYK